MKSFFKKVLMVLRMIRSAHEASTLARQGLYKEAQAVLSK
jgi:hypothetical protein